MRLFVSYNSRDRDRVEPLLELLCTLRPDALVYYAPHKNTLGAYWMQSLGEELAASDAMLLFIGSRVGPWQEVEFYDAFRRARHDDRPRILPVLLEDTTPGLHFLNHIHRISAKSLPPRDIVETIVAGLDALAIPAAAPLWRETNPYNGLFSQGTSGAAYFFGREKKTAEILNALRSGAGEVHILVGNSGVGKSSIVNAGVVAALRSQVWPLDGTDWPSDLADSRAWLQTTMKPGESPVKSLALAFARAWLDDPADREAQALKWVRNFREGSQLPDLITATLEAIAETTNAPAPNRLLLNIDQGEELYARSEKSEAKLFSQLVASSVGCRQLLTIASLRSDFYGQLQEDEALFAVTKRIDVPPMTRDEVINVIRKPVAALGAQFETPEIVPMIADATTRDPGTLPLLSYMMADAWEEMRRDEASDGKLRFPLGVVDVSGPLIERAEKFLRENPSKEIALRRLFTLRLAHVPKEGEPVRRRAARRDCDDEEWRLAAELAGPDWRLLSTAEGDEEPTAEVAHEALLRSWPRLERWLDEERSFLIWKGGLEAARQEWAATDDLKKSGALLMGLALDTARNWRETRGTDLSPGDRAFIDASLEAQKKREELEASRALALAKAQETSKRRGQWLVRGFAAASLVFAVLGGIATWQWRGASQARDEAELNLTTAKRNIDLAAQRQDMLEQALDEAEDARSAAEKATAFAEQTADRFAQEVSRADSALQTAEAELFQRRVERARLMARAAQRLLDEGYPDWALAVAVEAFPADARDQWRAISIASSSIFGSPTSVLLADALARSSIVRTLRLHEALVLRAAFSPDGRRIVTASRDGTARVWDAETGAEKMVLRGHEGGVLGATFSPDGMRLVTASEDGTARLWDAETGKPLQILRGHGDRVDSAAFSPDSRRIITASFDRTVRVWDAETGRELQTLRGHGNWVYCASFSPDGKWIVSASKDGTARIWDAETGGQLRVLRKHKGPVFSASFAPDGLWILSASDDGTARVWDAVSGAERRVLRGHGDRISGASFSSDGARIVTASNDGTARIWDAETGTERNVLRGHEGWVYHAVFSPDETQIVSSSADHTARLWKAGTEIEALRLNGHEAAVSSAAFSPDGTQIVTASSDATARVWDAATGAEMLVLRGHENRVSSAAFSPDGTRIITASADRTARIWDGATGAEQLVLRGHENAVWSAAFSNGGRRIVTASLDGTARIWDAQTGLERIVLHEHKAPIWSAAFSPDGRRIVTASFEPIVRIWDASTGAELQRLRGHETSVLKAMFSPDGTRVLTASEDGTARVWNAGTGAELQVMDVSEYAVDSAAFSPDGARIVTTSDHSDPTIWDGATGSRQLVLRGGSGRARSAAFSPDGTRIVTASYDGTARVWDAPLSLEALVDAARSKAKDADVLSVEKRCRYYLQVTGCE